MRMLPVTATLAALTTLTSLTGGTTSAHAGTDPAGPEIVSVGLDTSNGGYPTIGWGWHGLLVEVRDATPDDGHRYVVTASPGAGGAPVTTTIDRSAWWDGTATTTVGSRADYALDETYSVSVAEYDGAELVHRSPSVDFTPTAVGHPTDAKLVKEGRKRTVKAGSVVRIRWTGEWEQGIDLTQVVAARRSDGTFSERTRDFLVCEGSYCPTRRGVRSVRPGDEPVTRFRVPRRMAGRSLVIVSYGQQGGSDLVTRAPWGWEWVLRVRRG